MSQKSGDDSLTYTEHRQDEEQSLAEKRREEVVKRALNEAHAALFRDNYTRLANILIELLLPALQLNEWTVDAYDQRAVEHDLDWNYVSITEFLERPAAYRTPADESHLDTMVARARGSETPEEARRRTLREAFASFQTAAVLEGYIAADLETEQEAYEYQIQVARRKTKPESSLQPTIDLIPDDEDPKFTLFTGQPGKGKSTGLDIIVEDRIANGHKIFDLLDLEQAENILWDIESQHPKLNYEREKHDLPVGFGGHYDPPKVEVLCPLTPELAAGNVPYNDERDDFIVRPFVIPASKLNRKALTMMLPHSTPQQKKHIKAAYQTITKEHDDWSLCDFVRVVEEETNASERMADRIEQSLSTLQGKSYIRDGQSDHLLNWEDLFRDTDTIHCVTTAFMTDRDEKLLVLAYLLEAIKEERIRLKQPQYDFDSIPPMTLVMRELHELAPSDNARSKDQEEAAIQLETKATIQEMASRHRHWKLGLVCDTQYFKRQLAPEVRSHVDRIYQYNSQRGDVEAAVKTRVGRKHRQQIINKITQYDTGDAALIDDSGATYPLKMVPPMCHHFDTQKDSSGWHVRIDAKDDEELRSAPWDANIPSRLRFNNGKSGSSSRPTGPVIDFLRKAVDVHYGDDYVIKADLRGACNANGSETGGRTDVREQLVGRRLRDLYGDEVLESSSQRRYPDRQYFVNHPDTTPEEDWPFRKTCYNALSWTEWGEEWLEKARAQQRIDFDV